MKLLAILVSAAALGCFLGAVFSPKRRQELVLVGALLIILGTFVSRAWRRQAIDRSAPKPPAQRK